MNFGAIALTLNQLMQERAITLTELSDKTGISTPVLLRLRSGQLADPKISILDKLASCFNVSLDTLLGRSIINPLP